MSVADCYGAKHVSRMLPPEHTIVSFRPDPDMGIVDYLIEGSMMPEADSGAPPVVTLLFTITILDDAGRVRMTGEWSRCEAIGSWTVGEWASIDAYLDGMRTLGDLDA